MPATKQRPDYPMHDKLKALGTDRAAVQRFIDWLFDDEPGWFICEPLKSRMVDERLIPVRHSREEIMAMFFEIDLTVLDDEKRAMLDYFRETTDEKKPVKEPKE